MTRHTIAPLVVLMTTVFGALVTSLDVFFRMSYVLALALVTSYILARLNLHGLSVKVIKPNSRAQVGGYFEEEITVFNSGRMPRVRLEVKESSDLPGHNAGGVVNLPGRRKQGGLLVPGQRSLRVRTLCSRRGVFIVGPVKLASSDPLGFFRLERSFGRQDWITVWPATADISGLRVASMEFPGEKNARNLSSYYTALEASSVREYVQGDGINKIHWPSTAHHRKLMVKEFDAGRLARVWLLLDMERRVQAGYGAEATDELAISVAASIANRLLGMDMPVGLISYGGSRCFVPAHRGNTQLTQILNALASLKAEGKERLDRVILEEQKAISRYDTIVAISPSTDNAWVRVLGDMSVRREGVCAVLVDPSDFGGMDATPCLNELTRQGFPYYLVKRGRPLSASLSTPGTGSAGPRLRDQPDRMEAR
ncbi:MAG: DUF58 domain-containing protein [Chloroflexi bacterium]|nr:DUF58 domain-containing protein [Chloroflexota bacterium]